MAPITLGLVATASGYPLTFLVSAFIAGLGLLVLSLYRRPVPTVAEAVEVEVVDPTRV